MRDDFIANSQKLTFPRDVPNPLFVLQQFGAARIQRERVPYHMNTANAHSHGYIYLFTPNNTDFYIKSTTDNFPMSMSHTIPIYQMSIAKFRQLNRAHVIKTDVKSEFSQTALALGAGDGLWQACSFIMTGNPTLMNDANYFLPLMIGPLVGFANYFFQIKQFERRQDRIPELPVRRQYKMNSAALTFKMTLGMLGWEAGLFIALSVLSNMPTDSGSYIFLAGLFCGAGQAIGVLSANITEEMRKHGETKSSAVDFGKLFATYFMSGAVWYYLGRVDYAPGMDGFGKNALNAFLDGVTTFVCTTAIFMLTKPKDNVLSFLFCSNRCCPNPDDGDQDDNVWAARSRGSLLNV